MDIPRSLLPRLLLPAGSSRKKETDALGTLDAYSFIIKRLDGQSFDLHRLVHLAPRNWLRKEAQLAKWTDIEIVRLEDVFPDYEHSNCIIWRALLTHILYALKSDIHDGAKAKRTDLTWRYGMCLYSDGRYDEAESQILEVFET